MEEPWVQEAADALEKITRDPMADAVAGTVRIVSASAPAGRGRYQECELELLAAAAGIPDRTVEEVVVFSTRSWPAVGAVLPARISRSHPGSIDVDWDALGR
ncbi:MAG: hypothetical protein ABWY03_09320 [Microbacterium sp.]